MPSVVTKITNADGTEQSFGPVEIPKTDCDSIVAVLASPEATRVEALVASRLAEDVAAQEARSAAAGAANAAAAAAGGTILKPKKDGK